MRVAWILLAVLLDMATEESPSLAESVKLQLQQSGMLQPHTAAMVAMAADLQAEAAILAAGDWDAAGVDLDVVVSTTPHPSLLRAFCAQCLLERERER
jgi:hypothetical protein